MKKYVLMLGCFLFVYGIVNAQVVKSKDVPKSVTQAFKAKNASAKVTQWELDADTYIASFKDGSADAKSIFTHEGDWIKTLIEVEKEDLPSYIFRHVKQAYPSYTDMENVYFIKQAGEADGYVLDLIVTSENIVSTIYFTITGRFIKEDKRELPQDRQQEPITAENRSLKKKSVKPEKIHTKESYIITEDKVPGTVLKTFRKRFLNASNVVWYHNPQDTFYNLTCTLRNAATEGYISTKGGWISTISELNTDRLPSILSRSIDMFYKNYKIDKVQKEVRADKNDKFIVELIEDRYKRKGLITIMFFDKKGKIIEIIDPEVAVEKEPELSEQEKKDQARIEKEFEKHKEMDFDPNNIKETELPSGVGLWITRDYPEYVVKKAEYNTFDEFSEYGRVYKILIQRPGVNQPYATGYFSHHGELLKVEDDFKQVSEQASARKLSRQVKKAFSDTYPKLKDVSWQEGDNNTWIAVFLEKDLTNEAIFSDQGVWIQTALTIEPEKKIPSSIRTYMANKKPNMTINTCQMITNPNQKPYYRLEVYDKKSKTRSELKFTSKGELID